MTIEQSNDNRPSEKDLRAEGHYRAACPEWSGGGVLMAASAANVLRAGQVQIPHLILVCRCGVVKVLPLGPQG